MRAVQLSSHHVESIPLVLVADVLNQLLVLRKAGGFLNHPGSFESIRIFERQFDFEATEIGTTVALHDVQLLGMGVIACEPCFVIETDRIDDQGVAVPMSDRAPIPGWAIISGSGTAIRVDHAMTRV